MGKGKAGRKRGREIQWGERGRGEERRKWERIPDKDTVDGDKLELGV